MRGDVYVKVEDNPVVCLTSYDTLGIQTTVRPIRSRIRSAIGLVRHGQISVTLDGIGLDDGLAVGATVIEVPTVRVEVKPW